MRTVESPLERFTILWEAAIASPAVMKTTPDISPPLQVIFARPLVHSDGSKRRGIVSLEERIVANGMNNPDGTTSVKEIQVIFAPDIMTVLSSKELEAPHDATIGIGRLAILERAFEVEPDQ